MKKKEIIILASVLIVLTIVIAIFVNRKVSFKEVKTDDYVFTYDTTWKKVKGEKGVTLKHKKSGSKLNIQCMVLEDSYMDVDLKDIISDITYGIEKQNEGFKLISVLDAPSDKYDSYSYLYEDDMEQALVNVYKKDNKVVIAYFSCESEKFDIVLDSVDNIFDSIEIKTGEEIKLT